MPISAVTLAKIQELKAESLATYFAAVDPVEGAAKVGARAGSGVEASLQSTDAAIRGVIVQPPENGIARLRIAGGLVDVALPPDLLRQGKANPDLFRPGALLTLPADVPARPVTQPATLVEVHASLAQGAAPSVGPAVPLANAFPPGTLGAAIARLAGIGLPQAEAEGAVLPSRPETSLTLRPGLVARPVAPEIAEALTRAAGRQVPLGAAIETLLTSAPSGLPAPLAGALRALAALRPTALALASEAGLAGAIAKSGVFLESGLAAGLAPSGDLKQVLGQIRTLAAAAPEAGATPATSASPAGQTGPRDGALAVKAEPAALAELAKLADGAIERVKLNQLASLPDHPEIRLTDDRGAPMRIAVQIPLAPHGSERPQTAVLGLVIEHNPFNPEPPAYVIEDGGKGEDGEGFPWKIRLALDLAETGPVQAEVALRGQAVAVTLWAERQATAGRARAEIGNLHAALTSAAFEVTRLEVRDGVPHGRLPRAAPMLDRRT